VVSAFLNRIGNLGLLLIAGALLLGGLAGAAVVSHYDRLPAGTAASQENHESGQAQNNQKNQPGNQKRSHKQHQQD
jgi:hypothetical protein